MVRIVESADVSPSAVIGEGSSVWHLAQVREDAVLGENCVIGRGAYIGTGVHLGDNCKVQNYALVYEPAQLGHGVFIGPAAVLTNDHNPRAINPDGSIKDASDWEPVGVTIEEGCCDWCSGSLCCPRNDWEVGDCRGRGCGHQRCQAVRVGHGCSCPPVRLGWSRG
jgi:carbonic anhydrase/acetyltransferase-like protein (isoleucine patch superfamily)